MPDRLTRPLARVALAAAILVMPAAARASSTLTAQDVKTRLRHAAEAFGDKARERLEPLPEGEVRVQQAVIMSVRGRADWRPGPDADWNPAKVDDLLDPGAMIRTGRSARVVLRVGQNASVLVDRRSRVILPEIVREGGVLRTTAQVKRGRADFKVDDVGMTNDFTVVTPSTTLAVRGTGFAVQYGAFNGTEVAGARTNDILAIEIAYFLSRFSYYLSGGALSSDAHPHPALAALFETFGPPRLVSALIEDESTPELLDDTFERNPIADGRAIDNAVASLEAIQNLPIFQPMDDGGGGGGGENDMPPPEEMFLDQFDLDGFEPLTSGQIAQFVCLTLFDVFLNYDSRMLDDFGAANPGGFEFPGLNQLFVSINLICQVPGEYTEESLVEILEQVVAYCEGQFSHPGDVDLCISNFTEAATDTYQNYGGQ